MAEVLGSGARPRTAHRCGRNPPHSPHTRPRPGPPPPAQVSDGMCGFIAPPAGEACPAVVPVPFSGLGDDITSNSVVCCVYKLPLHHLHVPKLLPGAVEEVGGWLGGVLTGEWVGGWVGC